jgi:hypothetical protein
VPTIAVATDGGVSVIKDDGTVVDSADTSSILSISNGVEGIWWGSTFGQILYFATWDDISSGDGFGGSITNTISIGASSPQLSVRARKVVTLRNDLVLGNNSSDTLGLSFMSPNYSAQSTGMLTILTSTYNTGWMPGDIKMAALADTTAETFGDAVSGATVSDPNLDGVYDGEHVVNGDFATDVSGWAVTSNGTFTFSAGTGVIEQTSGANASAYQSFTTVVGTRYKAVATISGVPARILIGTSFASGNVAFSSFGSTLTLDFVATDTTTFISIQTAAGLAGQQTVIDNISVRLADPDRSVNGNGLAVHGSITKAPVATGADLVAYSGFSSSNYLEQPYNDDLDFGTGDFCVMGWFYYPTIPSGTDWLYSRDGTAFALFVNSTTFGANIGGVNRANTAAPASGIWHQFVNLRRDGLNELYVDGKLQNTYDAAGVNVSGSSQPLIVGNLSSDLTRGFAGSLALLRISGTAPTADQIRKIYEDERPLFQEDAKATLTGASDAVTALAHDPDTNLLHVGTPGGRSVFQGLRRVEEHTGTDNQSLAAISAVDGLVVEGK